MTAPSSPATAQRLAALLSYGLDILSFVAVTLLLCCWLSDMKHFNPTSTTAAGSNDNVDSLLFLSKSFLTNGFCLAPKLFDNTHFSCAAFDFLCACICILAMLLAKQRSNKSSSKSMTLPDNVIYFLAHSYGHYTFSTVVNKQQFTSDSESTAEKIQSAIILTFILSIGPLRAASFLIEAKKLSPLHAYMMDPKFVMIVDFVSMYPSIIASCGISPESIDSRDLNTFNGHRFSTLIIYVHVHKISPASYVLISIIGSDDDCNTDPSLQCIVAEKCCLKDEIYDAKHYVTSLYYKICNEDPLIQQCTTRIVNMTMEEMQCNTTSLGHTRCSIMCRHLKDGGIDNEWYWSSHTSVSNGCMVDWLKTADGHTTIVQSKEFTAHFYPGRRICSEACKQLMHSRKVYKTQYKEEVSKNGKSSKAKVLDQLGSRPTAIVRF